METKKYKLLRELPMTDVGTTFYRNGSSYYPCEKPDGSKFELSDGKGYGIHSNVVENNPSWFEEILPERYDILISELKSGKHISQYSILSILRIPEEKLQLVKQVIDSVLNDDPKIDLSKGGNVILPYPDYAKLYTQKQVDKAIEDAFSAARKKNYFTGAISNPYYYKTLEDYKNSNNKDK